MTKTKQNKFDHLYTCTGIARADTPFGLWGCGETYTLVQWLIKLFPGRNPLKYFEDDSEAYIVNYILTNTGKRLTRVRK